MLSFGTGGTDEGLFPKIRKLVHRLSMSVERCIKIMDRFAVDGDCDLLVDELAEIESELVSKRERNQLLRSLSSFLNKLDFLLSKKSLNEDLVLKTVGEYREELRKLKNSQEPLGPLDQLLLDMTRYQTGQLSAAHARATLSRYEDSLLALKRQFERSVAGQDQRRLVKMMRGALTVLEAAGNKLRDNLSGEVDYSFDDIRKGYALGTKLLEAFLKEAFPTSPSEPPEAEQE